MKEKKMLVLPKECEPFGPKAGIYERKFCHACGGWCFVNMAPCALCHGTGFVTVLLPVVEEAALVE